MRANPSKFMAFRGGRLKRSPVPPLDPRSTAIEWLQPNKFVKLLGIPFWEGEDDDDFFEQLYFKVKGIMSSWKEIKQLTVFGRTMIVNAMYFSRYRYVAQVMVPPAHITEAIVSDAQALVWDKTPNTTQTAEYGTDRTNRRWLKSRVWFECSGLAATGSNVVG